MSNRAPYRFLDTKTEENDKFLRSNGLQRCDRVWHGFCATLSADKLILIELNYDYN